MPSTSSITNGGSQSLLYNFAGHRCGGGAAPSNDLREIENSKMEISDDGPSGEEMSAIMTERIRVTALSNGLSQRLVGLYDEGARNGLSLNSPWPS